MHNLGLFLLTIRQGADEEYNALSKAPRATQNALSREHQMTDLHNEKGLTLVEVMVVVAILGIIAAVGATGVHHSLPILRLKGVSRDIFSVTMQAKAEAVRRGENVTILFDTVDNSYLMFLDRRVDKAAAVTNDNEIVNPSADPNANETVLLDRTPLPPRVSFDPNLVVNGTPHADGVSFANNALVFTPPRGFPIHAVTGGLGGGTIGLRAVDSSGGTIRQRTVTVSTAGRVKINQQ